MGLTAAILLLVGCSQPSVVDPEVARWQARAERVTIVRDTWGVPHIYGTTDADVVFGLMVAQAEDDFHRIEVNFLNAQGRLAEAEGEEAIWRDLRMRLFIDPEAMRAIYEECDPWLRDLMDAWADGLNYYLHTHPETRPVVLKRFEPWMALTFSEGSIGGDIERVSLRELAAFYRESEGRLDLVGVGSPESKVAATGPRGVPGSLRLADPDGEPVGSNGIAIAPQNTRDGNALLLINPHTSFFFRHEAHLVSEEGLNAYGALTWGQFFVYQGFNETAGWMHTSSGVDNIDEFLETVLERDGVLYYRYGEEERPVAQRSVTIDYRTEEGLAQREFTVYRTHHGPIVRADGGHWISVGLMEEPASALAQSFLRTKATNYAEFAKWMAMHTNASNNTVFADAEGNIAYFHSNFIPVRDPRFNYLMPVDGSDPATDWQGVHTLEQTPNVLNPSNGWIQNTNNWPYSVSGPTSPNPADYPVYMERRKENARGVHAIRLLEAGSDFTLQGLIDAAFDPQLPWFDSMIPRLVEDVERLPAFDARRRAVEGVLPRLRDWDRRWHVESVETAIAIFWAHTLWDLAADAARAADKTRDDYVAGPWAADLRVEALVAALARLEEDFGTIETAWGKINRYQRLTGDIEPRFDDTAASTPLGFTSGRWGSLASVGSRAYAGTKRWYGTSGNSFVAAVEFGDRLRARAVTAGGLSNDPQSPHFGDQVDRYASGDLREVYFYPEDVASHSEARYHPGESNATDH